MLGLPLSVASGLTGVSIVGVASTLLLWIIYRKCTKSQGKEGDRYNRVPANVNVVQPIQKDESFEVLAAEYISQYDKLQSNGSIKSRSSSRNSYQRSPNIDLPEALYKENTTAMGSVYSSDTEASYVGRVINPSQEDTTTKDAQQVHSHKKGGTTLTRTFSLPSRKKKNVEKRTRNYTQAVIPCDKHGTESLQTISSEPQEQIVEIQEEPVTSTHCEGGELTEMETTNEATVGEISPKVKQEMLKKEVIDSYSMIRDMDSTRGTEIKKNTDHKVSTGDNISTAINESSTDNKQSNDTSDTRNKDIKGGNDGQMNNSIKRNTNLKRNTGSSTNRISNKPSGEQNSQDTTKCIVKSEPDARPAAGLASLSSNDNRAVSALSGLSRMSKFREQIGNMKVKLEEESKQRQRSEDWAEFLTRELDAHINARVHTEEKYSRLREKTMVLSQRYSKLKGQYLALKQKADNYDGQGANMECGNMTVESQAKFSLDVDVVDCVDTMVAGADNQNVDVESEHSRVESESMVESSLSDIHSKDDDVCDTEDDDTSHEMSSGFLEESDLEDDEVENIATESVPEMTGTLLNNIEEVHTLWKEGHTTPPPEYGAVNALETFQPEVLGDSDVEDDFWDEMVAYNKDKVSKKSVDKHPQAAVPDVAHACEKAKAKVVDRVILRTVQIKDRMGQWEELNKIKPVDYSKVQPVIQSDKSENDFKSHAIHIGSVNRATQLWEDITTNIHSSSTSNSPSPRASCRVSRENSFVNETDIMLSGVGCGLQQLGMKRASVAGESGSVEHLEADSIGDVSNAKDTWEHKLSSEAYKKAQSKLMERRRSSIKEELGKRCYHKDSIKDITKTKQIWEQMMKDRNDDVVDDEEEPQKQQDVLDTVRNEIQNTLKEESKLENTFVEPIQDIHKTKSMWESRSTGDLRKLVDSSIQELSEEELAVLRPGNARRKRSNVFSNLKDQWENKIDEDNDDE